MLIKILVSLFILFAVSRAWLRYRDRSLGAFGVILWTILWFGVAAFTWWPQLSDQIAKFIGVGRGYDALVFLSILALFYGFFRLYIKVEYIEHEITSLVRALALREGKDKKEHHD